VQKEVQVMGSCRSRQGLKVALETEIEVRFQDRNVALDQVTAFFDSLPELRTQCHMDSGLLWSLEAWVHFFALVPSCLRRPFQLQHPSPYLALAFHLFLFLILPDQR
jgi:hypothetical protein